tara:strand:- start:13634 stop:13759 length:126 start_codon:yes stop_codon:yes gene_type:complete
MKVEVEIKKNGHIYYNGEIIAVLGQWNKYQDLPKPTNRKKK